MTLPNERTRAVLNTREFLYQLLVPKKTKGVPKVIRETARLLLRHYPSALDLKQAGEQAAEVFDAATADKYADAYCSHFVEAICAAQSDDYVMSPAEAAALSDDAPKNRPTVKPQSLPSLVAQAVIDVLDGRARHEKPNAAPE